MEGHERSALKDTLARLAAANALAGREPDDGGGGDDAAADDEAAAAVAALAGAPRAAEQGASDEGGSSRGPSPADPADAVALLARPEAQVVDVARAPDRAPRKRGATASERSGARTTFVDPPKRLIEMGGDGCADVHRALRGEVPDDDGDGDGADGDGACSDFEGVDLDDTLRLLVCHEAPGGAPSRFRLAAPGSEEAGVRLPARAMVDAGTYSVASGCTRRAFSFCLRVDEQSPAGCVIRSVMPSFHFMPSAGPPAVSHLRGRHATAAALEDARRFPTLGPGNSVIPPPGYRGVQASRERRRTDGVDEAAALLKGLPMKMAPNKRRPVPESDLDEWAAIQRRAAAAAATLPEARQAMGMDSPRRRGGHAKWGRRQQQMYERGPTPTVETTWVQCERCEKWRSLGVGVPEPDVEEWFCEMNSDPNYNNCDAPEQPFEDDEAAAAADGACSDFEETATATATATTTTWPPSSAPSPTTAANRRAPTATRRWRRSVWRPRRRRMRRRRCSPRSAAAPRRGRRRCATRRRRRRRPAPQAARASNAKPSGTRRPFRSVVGVTTRRRSSMMDGRLLERGEYAIKHKIL